MWDQTNHAGEHGSVVVTLALSVTMLMAVIALVTQTLFQLVSHTLFLRAVTDAADLAASQPTASCVWLADMLEPLVVDMACEETDSRLVATVSRPSSGIVSTRQTVRVVAHRSL